MQPCDSPSSWESQAGGFHNLKPLDHAEAFPRGYAFVNVDGGVFNNEPLELCRLAVARDDWDAPEAETRRNPRNPLVANRAVLLIDPFPNLFPLQRSYDPEGQRGLLEILKSLAAALVSQARFKPDELALAQNGNVASRYAIMPIRYLTEASATPERYAIACGSLGGFGGFLSKAFRHHDFMLGRRNCQRFLSHHFVLPADREKRLVNPLFEDWTNPATRKPFEVRDTVRVGDTEIADVVHLPIVPLLGRLASPDHTAMPPWPAQPDDLRIDALRSAITARADALKDGLVAEHDPNWALRQAINSFWWLNKRKWVERFAIEPVRKNLRERGLTG